MANQPKRLQDPTEAALSAIQSALAGRDLEPSPAAEPTDAAADARRRQARQVRPAADEDLFLDEARSVPRADEPVQPRRAANDDRQSIGQILQAIQRRPPRTSYVVATILAAAWIAAAGFIAWHYLPQLDAQLAQGPLVTPALVGLAAIVLVPVIFFYALAHAAWRAHELRLIAHSMTEVAVRLAEPETVARDSIVSVGQAIRREVAAMGDGVERALARAAELEALVHNEVSALEHAYNDNEIRIRGLLHDLTNQRDTLVAQAEQVRNAITSVHLELTHDISAVGDRVADSVSDSAQRINRMLSDKGNDMRQALANAGDNMLASLSERGDQLLERLESTSQQTTTAITAASERLTTNLDLKSDQVHGTFAKLADDISEMMSNRLDSVTDRFADRSKATLELMDGRSRELTASVVDAGSAVAETLLARVEEVNTSLKSTGDSLVMDFTLRGGEVVSQLEQTGARITDTIIARGNNVTDTFRQTAETLAEAVEASGEAAKTMLASRLQGFEDVFNNGGSEIAERISRDSATLGNLITRHLSEFDRTVKTYGGEILERLAGRTQELSQSLHTYVDGFDRRVASKTEDIGNSLDQRLLRFQETIDNRTASFNDAMSTRVIEVSQTLAEGGREVIVALEKRIGDVTGRADAAAAAIETRSRAAAENLGARMEDISRAIEDNAAVLRISADETEQKLTQLSGNVGGALTALSTQVASTLRQNASEVEQTLLGLSAEVARSFVGKADEVSAAVNARADELTRILDEKGGILLNVLGGKSQQFAEEVTRVTEHAVSAIDAKGFAFSRTMMDNSETIARMINEASDTATAAVGRSLAELQRSAADTAAGASTVLSRTLQDLENSTRSAIEYSKQTAASTVSEMLETHSMLRNDTTALFERLREANILLQEVLSGAHENMNSIEHTMVTRVSEFVATMNELTERSGSASGDVERHISDFHNVTTRVLGDLSQLATQFETHGRSLAEAVVLLDQSNRRTEETVSERRLTLDGLIAALDSKTQDLGDRLSRFSDMLDESLETAASRARDIARVIADSSVQGQRAVDGSLETAALRAREMAQAIAASSLEGQRAIDGSLEAAAERARELTQAIAASGLEGQRALDGTLEAAAERARELTQAIAASSLEGQRALDGSLEAAAERARELTHAIAASGLQGQRAVDLSLEAAANRASEIAQLIAQSGNEGVQAVAHNFDRLRATSEDERRRTIENMRNIYEQVSDESGRMFRDATERFQAAINDMKQMAMEMKREIDATRNELRRGVLEMPQETAESAAQMRRVIIDQIEALAELNRIVARHGRGLDAAEPARRSLRDEPVLAAPAPRSDLPPLRPLVRNERPERNERNERPADSNVALPAPPPTRRAEAAPLSTAIGNGRSGWLTELLNRASREPGDTPPEAAREPARAEDRSPRHSIESLDSLSVDIARMIDHDAAAELWDRYKRGERNVFTRRLYTLQGQQAFDEIRKKYRLDREFKQTVDRYIDEFERLLEEVARDDRGQVVARTYLTSETGKVYTMLAHAAGRFD